MTVIRDLKELATPLLNPVLTIGNFDGVHRGHLALFDTVKKRAAAIGGTSVVLTFDPHPLVVLRPQDAPPLLTPTEQKLRLIEQAGIDVTLCISFDREFSAISARDFVLGTLVKRIGVREIVVGYDYSFGHLREGNIALLREMGEAHGFVVHVLDPISIDGTPVSSTTVRRRVQSGDLAGAAKLLGRHYQISGTVVRGRNRGGRLLGFPTANLAGFHELTPKGGVYAVRVFVDGRCYDGVTNVGWNPTFSDGKLSIETHLLDVTEDLLGKNLRIHFVERLRDEESFQSIEALSRKIAEDVDRARKVLGEGR